MDVLDGLLSTNGALVVALATALWRYFAGAKAKSIEARVKETARAAFDLARGAVDAGHVDVLALRDTAKARARDMLARIDIPLKATVLALVDHELDVLAAELTRQHLDHQLIMNRLDKGLDDLKTGAAGVVDEMKAAEQRGLDNPLGGGVITWEEVKTPPAGNPSTSTSGEIGPVTKPGDVP